MDRKTIIAVILSLLVWGAWEFYNQKNLREYRVAQEAAAAAAAKLAPAATASPTAAASITPEAVTSGAPATSPELKAEPAVAASTQSVATPSIDYTFTNVGGGISAIKLLKHQGEKPGEPMVLNAFGTHPIGAVLQNPESASDPAYTVTVKDKQVVCERTNADGIHVTKTFSILQKGDAAKESNDAEEYLVDLQIDFSNGSTAPVEQPAYFIYAGSTEPIHAQEIPTYTGFDWYRDGKATFIDAHWFESRRMPLVGVETSAAHSSYLQTPGGVTWAGVKNQYFTSILSSSTPAQGVWAGPIAVKTDSKEVKGIQGGLEMPGFKLHPGQSMHQAFTLYAGPKEYRRLKELGHGEAEMMNFGMFKVISVFLLRFMNRLHDWLGSYAWAIVILTFVVRGALWPIQGAATKSMKKMQAIQPKMAEMKEKYKDDPTRVNQEMMKLYKEYGINPFAGCLPMFIQIPIFFGFYSMLGTAVELRNSHFLWVHDLSQPDTVFHLAGIPVNILPICMAATMVWQMSLSPKSGDAAQQKMFMFMPLVFVYFTYNFASALALYYTVQNILSIFQLYVTRNQMASAVAQVPPGGKSGGKKAGRAL